jgi:hypothetical protein
VLLLGDSERAIGHAFARQREILSVLENPASVVGVGIPLPTFTVQIY